MFKKLSLSFIVISAITGFMLVPAQADSLLPDNILRIFDLLGPDGTGLTGFFSSRSRTALFFVLGALVLYGVIQTISAAFQFMRSKGDPGQIEEATKAIKAIFYGIAAMMLGIVGIVIVFVFFNSSVVNPELFQVCVSSPQSPGCDSCKEEGRDEGASPGAGNLCDQCETIYEEIAQGRDLDGDSVIYGSVEELADSGNTTHQQCVDPLRLNN